MPLKSFRFKASLASNFIRVSRDIIDVDPALSIEHPSYNPAHSMSNSFFHDSMTSETSISSLATCFH